MPNLSTAATQAATAQQTKEVVLSLLTIDHDDLDEPVRLVDNTVDVQSRGNTHTAGGFELKLPQETGEKLPTVTLEIDNADRALTAVLRSITTKATVTHEVVLASSPDTVERGPFTYTTDQFSFTAEKIYARLAYEDILNAPIPSEVVNPTDFPGVFN